MVKKFESIKDWKDWSQVSEEEVRTLTDEDKLQMQRQIYHQTMQTAIMHGVDTKEVDNYKADFDKSKRWCQVSKEELGAYTEEELKLFYSSMESAMKYGIDTPMARAHWAAREELQELELGVWSQVWEDNLEAYAKEELIAYHEKTRLYREAVLKSYLL